MSETNTKQRKRYVKVTGSVWCDKHGSIHDDTTDPYCYGPDDPDNCALTDHRPVYVRAAPDEGDF